MSNHLWFVQEIMFFHVRITAAAVDKDYVCPPVCQNETSHLEKKKKNGTAVNCIELGRQYG